MTPNFQKKRPIRMLGFCLRSKYYTFEYLFCQTINEINFLVTVAAAAAGLLKTGKEWNEAGVIGDVEAETIGTLSTITPVGKNRHVVNAMTGAIATIEDLTAVMTVVRRPRTIGPNRYRGTRELKANYSLAVMDRRESTSTAMRIFRWKRRDRMCPTALKT